MYLPLYTSLWSFLRCEWKILNSSRLISHLSLTNTLASGCTKIPTLLKGSCWFLLFFDPYVTLHPIPVSFLAFQCGKPSKAPFGFFRHNIDYTRYSISQCTLEILMCLPMCCINLQKVSCWWVKRKGRDWWKRYAEVRCSWFDHWLDIKAGKRGLKVTALLFLGDEGKSVAFVTSREIERNRSFEGTKDQFFLGMLSSRGHWPHAIFQSNSLNRFLKTLQASCLTTLHFQKMTLLTSQRRQTPILQTHQLSSP